MAIVRGVGTLGTRPPRVRAMGNGGRSRHGAPRAGPYAQAHREGEDAPVLSATPPALVVWGRGPRRPGRFPQIGTAQPDG
jgi:hypothetical protein